MKKNKLLINLINLIVKFRYFFLMIIILLTILSGLNNKTNNIMETKKSNDINKIEILIEKISDEDTNNIVNNIYNIDYVKNVITEFKDNNALLILYVDNNNRVEKDIDNIITDNNYYIYDNSYIIKDNDNTMIFISIIVVILLILLLTTHSYFDILVGLIISILSVILNIGININNNILLIIIQLALLLYYYLVSINIYHKEIDDSKNKINALKKTLAIVLPKIISSSIIMFLPLIPLYFMKLDIGKNINNIVIRILICNILTIIFLLPSLLIIFNNYILKLRHRNIIININRLTNIIIKGRKIILPVFILFTIISIFLIPKYNYIFNEKSIKNNNKSDNQLAFDKINKNFGNINNVIIIIKNNKKDYNKELELATKLLHDKKIISVTNLGNIKLEDNLYLGNNINYHEFSNIFDIDQDTSLNIYKMYATEHDELIKLNDIDNYEIQVTNLLEYLYKIDINESIKNKVNIYYEKLNNYKALLENSNYSKYIIEYIGDIENNDTYKLLDTIKEDINKIYRNVTIEGESINSRNIKSLFNQNRIKIILIIILITLIALLFKTKSIGLSILLTTIIESNLLISLSLITIINNNIYYISYIIIKVLEIIFIINYSSDISNKYIQLRKKHTKKTSLNKTLTDSLSKVIFSILFIIVLSFLQIKSINNIIVVTNFYIGLGFIITILLLVLVIPSILYTCDRFIINTKIVK